MLYAKHIAGCLKQGKAEDGLKKGWVFMMGKWEKLID
jgi:hypothetical protein